MKFLLERKLNLHAEEEPLVPKHESLDVDQPQEEVHGMDESTTQIQTSELAEGIPQNMIG